MMTCRERRHSHMMTSEVIMSDRLNSFSHAQYYSSALVVKPSGHHLKLTLKMQNYAKAMFKPMRWGLKPPLVIPRSLSNAVYWTLHHWRNRCKHGVHEIFLYLVMSGSRGTRRLQKTSSILLTSNDTMQRSPPFTWTGMTSASSSSVTAYHFILCSHISSHVVSTVLRCI